MVIARYGICIVEIYHRYISKVKVKITKNVKNTQSLITQEQTIVEMSDLCQNILQTKANKTCI